MSFTSLYLKNNTWILFIYLIVTHCSCNVQNYKSKIFQKKTCLSISVINNNYFYFGAVNSIEVNGRECYNDSVFVVASLGKVEKTTTSLYTIHILNNEKLETCLDTIKLFSKVNGKDILLYETYIQCIHLPPPVCAILGTSVGEIKKRQEITKKELLSSFLSTSYGYYYAYLNFDYYVKVISFTLSTTINGSVVESSSQSNKMTKEQNDLIQQLKKGDKVYFENIKAIAPDAMKYDMPPIMFKIVDF